MNETDYFDDNLGELEFHFNPGEANTSTKTPEPDQKDIKDIKETKEIKTEVIEDDDIIVTLGDSNEKDKPTSTTNNLTEAYFDYMKTNGFLDIEEDFVYDGTEEKLFEAHAKTLEKQKDIALKTIFEGLPENVKNLTLYSLNGGEDINMMYNLLNPAPLSIEDEDNQIHTIKTYYKNFAKWDDSKIDKFLSRLDEDDLKEEAQDALFKIEAANIELNKSVLDAQEKEQQRLKKEAEANIETLKASIKTASFLEEPRKKTLTNFIFNPVRKQDGMVTDYVRVLNKIQSNPTHMVQLADLLFDYDEEKGLVYDRFEKKAGTTIRADLKKKLEQSIQTKINNISKPNEKMDWSRFF